MLGLPLAARQPATEPPPGASPPRVNPMGDSSPDARLRGASWRLTQVYHDLLQQSTDDPRRGPAQIAGWQRALIDFALGYQLDATSFWKLEAARLQTLSHAGKASPSGVPQFSSREIQEAKELHGLDCLRKVQWGLVHQLEDYDAEVLAVLAFVHLEVYARQSRPQSIFWLSQHSRAHARDLAVRYQEAASNSPLTVALLVELGNQQRASSGYDDGLEAQELFEQALDLAPEHRAARYWAGFLAEKYGRTRRAAHHFRFLTLLDPTDHEARLRWGINRLRLGGPSAGEAESALLELARDGSGTTPEWMRRVAYSQLVQALEDRPQPALELAREGLAVFPDEATLHLQVAYHLRLDAWDAAREALGKVETARPRPRTDPGVGGDIDDDSGSDPGGDLLGPRARYDLAREEGLEINRRWLDGAIQERLPVLRQVLTTVATHWHTSPSTRPEPVQSCDILAFREGGPR